MRRIGFAPLTRLEPIEPVGADGHAHQPQGWVADRGGHAPYLAVAALGQDEAQRAVGRARHPRGPQLTAVGIGTFVAFLTFWAVNLRVSERGQPEWT